MKTYAFIQLAAISFLFHHGILLAEENQSNSYKDEARGNYNSYTWSKAKEGVAVGVRLYGTKLEIVLGMENTNIQTNTRTKFSYIKKKPNFNVTLKDKAGLEVAKTAKGQSRKIDNQTVKINTVLSAIFRDAPEKLVFFNGLTPQFVGVIDLKDEFSWKEAGHYKIKFKMFLLKESAASNNILEPFELPDLITNLALPSQSSN